MAGRMARAEYGIETAASNSPALSGAVTAGSEDFPASGNRSPSAAALPPGGGLPMTRRGAVRRTATPAYGVDRGRAPQAPAGEIPERAAGFGPPSPR